MKDKDVVKAFVKYLRDNGHPGLCIDRYPDEANRSSPDIDAVAGPFAIEHTSIDTLPNQRRDSDWFMSVIGNLEAEIKPLLPYRLVITLEYEGVRRGQDWSQIHEAIKTWIIDESHTLPDGKSVIENVTGIPFRLSIIKSSDRPPGLIFSRFQPGDNTLSERIKQGFDKKAKKLNNYQKPGTTTILLVENNDIALMNEQIMLEAIQTAYPVGPPTGVDEIWYVDTSIEKALEYQNFTVEI